MCLFFTLNSLLSLYYQSFKLVKIFDRFANLFQSCSFFFLFLFAIQFFFCFYPFFAYIFFVINDLNRSKFLTGSSFFTVFSRFYEFKFSIFCNSFLFLIRGLIYLVNFIPCFKCVIVNFSYV